MFFLLRCCITYKAYGNNGLEIEQNIYSTDGRMKRIMQCQRFFTFSFLLFICGVLSYKDTNELDIILIMRRVKVWGEKSYYQMIRSRSGPRLPFPLVSYSSHEIDSPLPSVYLALSRWEFIQIWSILSNLC